MVRGDIPQPRLQVSSRPGSDVTTNRPPETKGSALQSNLSYGDTANQRRDRDVFRGRQLNEQKGDSGLGRKIVDRTTEPERSKLVTTFQWEQHNPVTGERIVIRGRMQWTGDQPATRSPAEVAQKQFLFLRDLSEPSPDYQRSHSLHQGNSETLVIGAGVAGLTTAVKLLEAGYPVTIWARDLPQNTTSAVAGALWLPHKIDPPAHVPTEERIRLRQQVTAWGQTTLQELRLLQADPASGVTAIQDREVSRQRMADPWWVSAVDGFRRVNRTELPEGYRDGYIFNTVVVDPKRHLDYLMQRFVALGGQIEQRNVTNLAEAFAEYKVVVNSSGLGARELVRDEAVYPARGQVIRIRQDGPYGRLTHGLADDDSNTYVIPHPDYAVLGGTFQVNDWNTKVDPHVTRDILERSKLINPAFATITAEDILSVAVGLRPMRDIVRVEKGRPEEGLTGNQRVPDGSMLFHHYGLGGSGYTLVRGSANDTRILVVEGRR